MHLLDRPTSSPTSVHALVKSRFSSAKLRLASWTELTECISVPFAPGPLTSSARGRFTSCPELKDSEAGRFSRDIFLVNAV